jgi:hypothetical protein
MLSTNTYHDQISLCESGKRDHTSWQCVSSRRMRLGSDRALASESPDGCEMARLSAGDWTKIDLMEAEVAVDIGCKSERVSVS